MSVHSIPPSKELLFEILQRDPERYNNELNELLDDLRKSTNSIQRLTDVDLSAHAGLTNNPHSVSYAQVGAIQDAANTVDDTHIDWGAGAGQVDLDDVPDSSNYKKMTAAEVDELRAWLDDVTLGSDGKITTPASINSSDSINATANAFVYSIGTTTSNWIGINHTDIVGVLQVSNGNLLLEVAGDIDFDDNDVINGAIINATGLVIDTDVFYVDPSNDYIGMGSNTSNTSNQLHLLMNGAKDILVDGSTNKRTISTGVMRFEQQPNISATRCVTTNIDINSQADTHAMVVNMLATSLAPGEFASCYDINIDRNAATGGIVRGFEMSVAGAGTLEAHMLHADPGVIPLTHSSGSFINVEKAWDENGGFTDVTTAFNSTVTDVTIFSADADKIYIGMAAAFNEIEVNLATNASNPGVKPTFHYSNGSGGWVLFTPTDETIGFRQTGVINWMIADLGSWAQDEVNGTSGKFWIRITRTQAGLGQAPVEDTIQVSITTAYTWDENADLTVNDIVCANLTPSGTVDGIDIATDVGANTSHRGSAGTDHSDVGLNNTHRGLTNNPHSVEQADTTDYVKVSDVKSQNTAAGSFSSGVWRTRVINTEDNDASGIASISSNQITLAAGTYECLITCPVYRIDRHQARLQNTSDATTTIIGMSMFAPFGIEFANIAVVAGRFTIASSKTFEVQHRCQTSRSGNGFGLAANFTSEVYTIAQFWRVAA